MSIETQPVMTAQVITANTVSNTLDVSAEKIGEYMSLVISASAVSGTTPSLTPSVLWSADGTNFYPASPADNLPAITAAGGTVYLFQSKAPYYQVSFAVTGTTPSFTVTATAFIT